MLLSMCTILNEARKGRYGIAQPDFINIGIASMYLEAAQRAGSPIILGFGEEYMKASEGVTLRHLVRLIETLSGEYCVPVVLHLDHGSSFENCAKAISAGFTSVMIDGSSLPFEENVELTRKVVKMARPAGVSVEGELGHVGKGDDMFHMGKNIENSRLTDPELARIFVEKTRVDALAVSIGTVHGEYRTEPDIRLDLLSDISSKVQIPLVLHGASGTGYDTIRECVKRGICKVNIYTDLAKVLICQLREELNRDKPDLVSMLENVHNSVVEELLSYIKVLKVDNRG